MEPTTAPERSSCLYDGCDADVLAKGKCPRHYSRDKKREAAATRSIGPGRPSMDARVYKLRVTERTGVRTVYIADAERAARVAKKHADTGTLSFFGVYHLSERLV